MVIAFDAPTAQAFKAKMPDIKTHWLTGFKRATPSSSYQPSAATVADTVRSTGVDGVGMNGIRDVIDASFIDDLRKGGCEEFHVWTIDSVADAKYFAGLGAMGITTNVPAIIGTVVPLER
jgi:glycerophosphoryl diester phosphodiesterase